jgi:GT2 family glycosyltransferase
VATLHSIEALTASPLWDVLFDEAWYFDQYPETVRALDAGEYRHETPFLDSGWYQAAYPEVKVTAGDALGHYITQGAQAGLNPNPIFDEVWYRSTYNLADSLPAKYVNGYHHFLSEGSARGFNPSPLFDERWYRGRYPDVAAAIESGMVASGYHDYIRRNRETERDPCPYFDVAWYRAAFPGRQHVKRFRYFDYLDNAVEWGLNPGPYFEENWYRMANSSVPHEINTGRHRSGYHHFLYEGARLNFVPNPYFMPEWYRKWYSHVPGDIGAFEHYVMDGIGQGLSPNPYFDEARYLNDNPDVEAAVKAGRYRSGHHHFLAEGESQKRAGSPLFDSGWYAEQYAEVREYIANGLASGPYDHFCRYGRLVGRNSILDFDEAWYATEYGESVNALLHFLTEGMTLGYAPAPRDPEPEAVTATVECARLELRDFLANHRSLDCGSSEKPIVSILLVLRDRAELTLRCLRSIANWVDVPYEVIVVDDNSRDETRELLRQVRGIRIAESAVGDYLLFLHNDCELQVGAVRPAVEILNRESDVGAVGGKIIQDNGVLEEAGGYFKENGFTEQIGKGRMPFESEFMHRRDVPHASGTFLMTPRSVYQSIGAFDIDYCPRLWEKGLRVVYNPGSIVLHHGEGMRNWRFRMAAETRDIVQMRHRHREYFAAVPDRCKLRTAYLLIVDRIPCAAYRPDFVQQMLAEKNSLTIFPVEAWKGSREDVAGLIPGEVEIVAGLGVKDLVDFCRKRRGMYTGIVVWSDGDELYAALKAVKQELPDLRVLTSGSPVGHQYK